MYMSSLSYPHHQYHLIELLRLELDKIFYDVYSVSRPILVPESILKQTNVSTNALKEVFHVQEGGILRFDHTHISFKYKKTSLNERNFGNVFRREPKSSNRWREFFQYDVDYNYTDHSTRPLKKLISFLGQGFTIMVNDLSIVEQVNREAHIQRFFQLHPELKEIPVVVDPGFKRGWDYYNGLIFQISFQNSLALAGGGVYNNSSMIGFGIGVNRLINLALEHPPLLERIIPIEPLVWVRYTENIPINLLDEMESRGIKYHLSKVHKNLFKEYKKINMELVSIRKRISSIITVSNIEDKSKIYNYKTKSNNTWGITELCQEFQRRNLN